MGTFSKTSVNAVESAFHWNMYVFLVNLTISSRVLRIAHARSVITPTSISTIIRASFNAAIFSSKSRLAPASSVQAETIVGTIVNANGN